ncbi:hypothetical protein HOJ01_01365 [bacterium]|jgi:hypothetical protein|nr:hypothetical protein [bacterium]MBT6293438.1 hypothetical protein [bacterium]
MNEVTMFDVRSYLDGEIKPGIFNLLEKMKVKKIEKLISEKTNFILNSQLYMDQLPDHPCSASMFPVFREKFLKGNLSQESEWFRVLSSPGILKKFTQITPDILNYVPDNVLTDDAFLIRFCKYNQVLMMNIIREAFTSYNQIITYSFTGNDFNSTWFFQNVTNQTFINTFAPNYVDEKGKASFKTKQVEPLQLWTLNAELYLSKIKSIQLNPDIFNFTEESISIQMTPGISQYTQEVDATSYQAFDPRMSIVPVKDLSRDSANQNYESNYNFSTSSQVVDDPTNPEERNSYTRIEGDEARKLNFSVIDARIIGKEAYYFNGEETIKVRIQNLSYNFEQIYLQVLEDTYPGSDILIIDVEKISYKLSENQAWLNPEVLKLIA